MTPAPRCFGCSITNTPRPRRLRRRRLPSGAARSRASLTTFTPAVEALPTEPVRGHGFRHHTLLSEGGRLRQRGYGLEVILPALQEVNARFEEPHTDAKVRELAADIVDRYEPGEGPRPEPEAAVAPAAQAAEVVQPQDAALRPVPVERPELPQDRAGVERGIAELTTWRLARSQRRNGAIVYSEDGGPWKVLGKVDRAVLMQMLAEAAVMYVPVKGGGSAPDAPIPFVIPKTNDLDRYLGFIANKVWVDDDDSEGYYGRVREWAEDPGGAGGGDRDEGGPRAAPCGDEGQGAGHLPRPARPGAGGERALGRGVGSGENPGRGRGAGLPLDQPRPPEAPGRRPEAEVGTCRVAWDSFGADRAVLSQAVPDKRICLGHSLTEYPYIQRGGKP